MQAVSSTEFWRGQGVTHTNIYIVPQLNGSNSAVRRVSLDVYACKFQISAVHHRACMPYVRVGEYLGTAAVVAGPMAATEIDAVGSEEEKTFSLD